MLTSLCLLPALAVLPPQEPAVQRDASPAAESLFDAPLRLTAGGAPIRVEAPGYAAPCLADVDADGHADLLVGQFADGKVRVFRGLADGGFAAGAWLEAAGDVAQVPGVW